MVEEHAQDGVRRLGVYTAQCPGALELWTQLWGSDETEAGSACQAPQTALLALDTHYQMRLGERGKGSERGERL